MSGFLSEYYLWLKALHLISVISWMAGLLYLPRLFIYHCNADKKQALVFVIMERRLLRAIMNPAMICSWVFGLSLMFMPGIVDWASGWPWVKAFMVVLLTWFHHWLSKRRKEFERGKNTRSARLFRLLNEIPTIAMITIVIMVIVQPF